MNVLIDGVIISALLLNLLLIFISFATLIFDKKGAAALAARAFVFSFFVFGNV